MQKRQSSQGNRTDACEKVTIDSGLCVPKMPPSGVQVKDSKECSVRVGPVDKGFRVDSS